MGLTRKKLLVTGRFPVVVQQSELIGLAARGVTHGQQFIHFVDHDHDRAAGVARQSAAL